MLQAPVVAYRTGHGVIDGRNPLSKFLQESHACWAKTDCVLVAGSNLRIPPSWGIDDQMKVIRIDVDPLDHHLTFRPDLAVTARLEQALPLLLERTAAHNRKRESRTEEMEEIRAG